MRYVHWLLLTVGTLAAPGCGDATELPTWAQPATAPTTVPAAPAGDGASFTPAAETAPPAAPVVTTWSSTAAVSEPSNPVPRPPVPPLFIEGVFVPSGWMGAAEKPTGPLTREASRVRPHSPPTCEKWCYRPTDDPNEVGFIGVAYQCPDGNFGDRPGMQLSGKGYTRLTFMARGARGGEQLLVRSGGCTAYAARYPASHEVIHGEIILGTDWTEYEIPLPAGDIDLSNVCSVLSFYMTRDSVEPGTACEFYVDTVALRGPSAATAADGN